MNTKRQLILELLKENGFCYPKANLPEDIEYDGKNVFMGIGLWSKEHGLSRGIPICMLSMLMAADKLRNGLGEGTLYILIADSSAQESNLDRDSVTPTQIDTLTTQYNQLIPQVCKNLGIKNFEISLSSQLDLTDIKKCIADSPKYLDCVAGSLRSEVKNYILNQTAIVRYYATNKGCALKIGWCYDASFIQSGLITRQKDLDETWFDDYYTTLGQPPIGFGYTQPGITLYLDQVESCAPYCHAKSSHRRVLFGDTVEAIKDKLPFKVRGELAKNLLQLILGVKSYQIMKNRLHSKPNESNKSTMIDDLAAIAALTLLEPALSARATPEASQDRQESETAQPSYALQSFSFFSSSSLPLRKLGPPKENRIGLSHFGIRELTETMQLIKNKESGGRSWSS